MEKIKEIIRKKLAEMSATGMGGASFSPGQGMNYATPKAFKKTKNIKDSIIFANTMAAIVVSKRGVSTPKKSR